MESQHPEVVAWSLLPVEMSCVRAQDVPNGKPWVFHMCTLRCHQAWLVGNPWTNSRFLVWKIMDVPASHVWFPEGYTYTYRHMYVCMSVCLYVCMSVCLYVCMSVCLYVCMSVCLYVCMSVCLYVCMCVCVYVCMCVCVYVCMCVCVYVCMYICMYVCMYVCMCVCVYVCMYVCMCVCVCVYVCMFVCVYIYIYIPYPYPSISIYIYMDQKWSKPITPCLTGDEFSLPSLLQSLHPLRKRLHQ